jgi:mono/diheme cytochrome c family protein
MWIIFLPFVFLHSTSFITKYEYGSMLYKNPRGIGCVKCHGASGDGAFLVSYFDQKRAKSYDINTPRINHLSLDKFSKVLKVKKNRSLIMPTYFLTDEEIESLHYYITNIKGD